MSCVSKVYVFKANFQFRSCAVKQKTSTVLWGFGKIPFGNLQILIK